MVQAQVMSYLDLNPFFLNPSIDSWFFFLFFVKVILLKTLPATSRQTEDIRLDITAFPGFSHPISNQLQRTPLVGLDQRQVRFFLNFAALSKSISCNFSFNLSNFKITMSFTMLLIASGPRYGFRNLENDLDHPFNKDMQQQPLIILKKKKKIYFHASRTIFFNFSPLEISVNCGNGRGKLEKLSPIVGLSCKFKNLFVFF